MKAMLTAFVAIAVIAFGASAFLKTAGFSSEEVQASDSVRLN